MQSKNTKDFFFEELLAYTKDNHLIGNKLIEFCNYIKKSNKLYNLTSIKNINDMLIKHVLDSLSINEYILGNNILDIGSGAGLPGIPLALVHPHKDFLLMDSNNKKIIFLNHVKINLDIENIDLLHERIEDFDNKKAFDSIICRSYASLPTIYSNSIDHLNKNGVIIAMKGKYPHEEISALKNLNQSIHFEVARIEVPRLSAERHAVIIYKK